MARVLKRVYRPMRIALLLLLFLFVGTGLPARELSPPLNRYLDQELRKFAVPNLEVLVVSSDSVLYHRADGPESPGRSAFYIGSVSKSLTAFGIMRLVEQGKLSLDDKVTDLLPEIAFAHSGNSIAVRHLLHHTTGIRRSAGFGHLPALRELTGKRMLIRNRPGDTPRHEYSNLNYALLGMIIERVSGVSYAAYMQQEVFGPLNMQQTFAGVREEVGPMLVDHYQYLGPFPRKSRQLNYAASAIPAGFISASAADLGRFLRMQLGGGTLNDHRLIDSSLLQLTHTPWNGQDHGYAMGWKQGWYNNSRVLQHLGTTANSWSGIFLLPQQGLGLIVLSNSNSLAFTEEVAAGLLGILTNGEPQQASRAEFFLRWGVLLGLLLLPGHFLYQITQAMRGRYLKGRKTILRSMILNLLVIAVVIIGFPFVAGIPFRSLLQVQPDIGLLILASGLLPVLLGMVRLMKVAPAGSIARENN